MRSDSELYDYYYWHSLKVYTVLLTVELVEGFEEGMREVNQIARKDEEKGLVG